MSGGGPPAIAVVGLGCVFPGAADVDAFWALVHDGIDAVGDAPAHRLDPALVAAEGFATCRGGFVDEVRVDPARFGIMPVAVEGAEPDQFVALATAAAALDDVGDLDGVARERVGVVLGRGAYLTPGLARLDQRVRTANQLLATLRDVLPDVDDAQLAAVRDAFRARLGEARPESAIGLVPNLAASRIANRLDLAGPAYTVDAACASSLIAVDAAVGELASGRCDLVLAGGVHHCHDVTLWSVFDQLGALSASGRIRPFSRDADGILIGEGTGVLALERLDDAERLGHRVYALVRGTGVASDGRDASLMSPRVEGQVLALERAWRAAGLDPADVGLVEGHGTATAAGDRAELDTLRRVFGKDERGATAVLGSVKSQIGHAMPAAGAAGLVKAVLALHHGVLPPTLGAEEPHPALADTRFRLLDSAQPWEGVGRRLAGVDAFGFGGINAHVVLEAHGTAAGTRRRVSTPGDATPRATPDFRLSVLRIAGADAAEVADRLTAVTETLAAGAAVPHDVLGAGPCRLSVVDPDAKRLALAARVVAKGAPWRGRNDVVFEPEGLVGAGGRVAFLFPGVEPTFDADPEPVAAWFDAPLPALPEGATPLEAQGRQIFAAGRLLHDALGRLRVAPHDVVGHSLGEWTGVFTSELMPAGEAAAFLDALEPGALEVPGVVYLALGCGAEVAAELADGLDGVVVSHDNCPHQSVLCGPPDGIAAAAARMAERKVMGQELPFRSGFHSPAFEPYLDVVREHWARMPLQPARTPMWSATTADRYPDDPDAVRELAVRHLLEPVRFRQLVERLWDDGVRVFVQLGVGSLVAFCEDTLRGRDHLAISALVAKRGGLDQLVRVAAALWAEGVDVDLAPLRAPAGAAATSAAGPAAGPTVALDLGVPLVRLPADAALAVGAPAPGEDAWAGVAPTLGAAHHALLDETRAASEAVARALAGRGRRATVAPVASAPTPAEPADPEWVTEARRVDLASYPWLADHCFYRQPAGWPHDSDRFPVVPMTTMVEWLGDVARRLAPGRVVTAISDVRALRWLPAAPATEVTLRARRLDDDRVEAAIEGYTRGIVHLADAPATPPAPRTGALANPRPSPRDAQQLYVEHHMFHGPAFQGVRSIAALGDDGVDGTIEVLATPGATLDNAGQVYGWWVMASATEDFLALPQSIERIAWFGEMPPVGERLDVAVRITALDERTVRADLDLCHDGRVVVRIDAWVDRRFDSDEPLWLMLREPEHHLLASDGPAGASGPVVVDERWRDSASRELMARRYLNASEREAYEALNPKAQRLWLLGRIAAKDAVRRALWAAGDGPVFPAEITLGNDDAGRPVVLDGPGAGASLSLAHTEWVGAAHAVLPGEGALPAVGVDVELVEPRSDLVANAVLGPDERALLGGAPDAEWLTRVWAAKEAVGKAAGTGLAGRPKDLPLRAVDGERLLVGDRWVATAIMSAPVQGDLRRTPAPPPDGGDAARKAYAVAWTD